MAGLGAQHPGLGAPPWGRPRARGASEVRGRGCVLCSVQRKSQLWWRLFFQPSFRSLLLALAVSGTLGRDGGARGPGH